MIDRLFHRLLLAVGVGVVLLVAWVLVVELGYVEGGW